MSDALEHLKRLQATLAVGDATRRRAQLRKLATDFIKSHFPKARLEDLFAKSPIVGTGVNQLNVRPLPSGLRDALSEDVLAGLALAHSMELMGRKWSLTGVGTANRALLWRHDSYEVAVELAIESPKYYSAEDPGSKTGFVFGKNRLHPTRKEIIEATSHLIKELDKTASAAPAAAATTTTITHTEDTTSMTTEASKAETVSEIAEAAVAASTPETLPTPDENTAKLIDLALSSAGIKAPISKIVGHYNSMADQIKAAAGRISRLEKEAAAITLHAGEEIKGDDTIPDGKITTANAKDLFGIKGRGSTAFNFEVPVWEWDAPNHLVPAIDEEYIFRPLELLTVLEAIITNQRCFLHGHSGTGKTTLIEQVAARLGYMFVRINFDSEITRMDLVGKDVIRSDGSGGTYTEWEDGVLPKTMAMPAILCMDEFDFIRSDVSYVMQRALEGEGFMVTEDRGRVVKPHHMFRVFATGNTCGQGDEYGMYPGARPQSMALLDRFTLWGKIDYLDSDDRAKLIEKAGPGLKDEWRKRIGQYVTEHMEAFKTARVLQPMSPRSFMSLTTTAMRYMDRLPDEKKAMREALEVVVLNRSTAQDAAVLRGIIDRVFG